VAAREGGTRVTPRGRLLLWAPVGLLLAYEFYLSSQSVLPGLPGGFEIPHFDKLEHAVYYFLMGAFAVRAARFGEGWNVRRTVIVLVASGFVYGCVDEFHQSFVPGRASEVGDVAADVLGVTLAALAGERLWRRLGLENVVK
jgi:VanZ family protein